jgi:hypothetical protein
MKRLEQKTSTKVVLKMFPAELKKDGFDAVWDKVRSAYPYDKYDIISISSKYPENDEGIYFVEFKIKQEDEDISL